MAEQGMVVKEPMEIMEQVLLKGELEKLTPAERVDYYGQTCKSMGLNPLTKPFEFIRLKGKLKLYATKNATEQLRKNHKISIEITDKQTIKGIYVVSAKGTTPDGRRDESTGAVPIGELEGDDLANALMKAETKAKRRVTLSLVGLGFMDESEVETTPAVRVDVDVETGEIEKVPEPTKPPPGSNFERVKAHGEQLRAELEERTGTTVEATVLKDPVAAERSAKLREYAVEKGLDAHTVDRLMNGWANGPNTPERFETGKDQVDELAKDI